MSGLKENSTMNKKETRETVCKMVRDKWVYATLDDEGIMQFVSACFAPPRMREESLTENDVRRLLISGEASDGIHI